VASGISPTRRAAAAQRRDAILEAARTVFARQGYANTVVDDIAVQAGIGKGTLYLYFPSKEQIYLAALLEEARRLDADSRTAMSAAATWRDKLRAFVEMRLRYFDEHTDFMRIYMTEFRMMCLLGKSAHPELNRLAERCESQLAQMFAEARGKGEIRDIDPELAALTVSDLLRGLMERRLRHLGRPVGQPDTEFALDLVHRALGTQNHRPQINTDEHR
jgi:TetR/AcrR family fatty acid metabolism transcriptional regulator